MTPEETARAINAHSARSGRGDPKWANRLAAGHLGKRWGVEVFFDSEEALWDAITSLGAHADGMYAAPTSVVVTPLYDVALAAHSLGYFVRTYPASYDWSIAKTPFESNGFVGCDPPRYSQPPPPQPDPWPEFPDP